MATPLQTILTKSCRLTRPNWCWTRLMSSRHDRDGPPPWAAVHVPSGKTFTAINMAKMQNKDIWRRRQDYVNRPWKQIVTDYNRKKEDSKDQPLETPPKLLMIRLVLPLKGSTKKEKNILLKLGLREKWKPNIIPNKQELTSMVKHVKHLVEIFPVTFPYGEPQTAEDVEHAYLCDNGAFVIKKKICNVDQIEGQVTVCDEVQENKFEMKQELIDRTLELKKMKYQINQEYFPTKYVYEKNQDKKEWRYKGNTDTGYDKIWH